MDTPTKTRPRTKSAEVRREDLMNAAQALFLKKGVGATAIEEITAGADVAKGTFYLHFSSKDDIHSALAERFQIQYVEGLQRAVIRRPEADWSGKLSAWVKAAVTGFLDNGPLVNMIFHAHPQIPDGRPNAIVEHLKGLLKAGAEAGAWTVDDPAFVADFLFGGLHGVIDDALIGEKRVIRTQLLQRLHQLFFRTVGLPES